MKTNFLVVGLMVLLGVSAYAAPVGPAVAQQTLTTTPAGALVNASTNFFTSNLSLMEQALTGWLPGNGTASFATNATFAKYAGLATNAITAITATTALTAIVATTALTATVATNALTANLATTATMAGYALAAGTATNTPFGPAGNMGTQNSNSVVITGGTINGAHSGSGTGLTNLPITAINVGSDSVALMSQVVAQIAAATNGLGTGAVGTSSTNGPVTYSGVVNSSALSGTNNFAANVNVGHALSANYVNVVNLQAAQINASAVNAGGGLEANEAMWNVGASDQWMQYGGSNQDDSIYWDDFYGTGHTLQLSNNLMVVTGTIQATKFVGSTGANITNGLATTAYVNGITNGLATTAYVTAAVAAGGGQMAGTVVGTVVTNTATNYEITVTGAGTVADNGTYALASSGIVGATLYTNLSSAKGIFQMASVANWGIGTWSNTTLITLDYASATSNLTGTFNVVIGSAPAPAANINWSAWTTAQWVVTNVTFGNLAAGQITGSATNQFATPAQVTAQIQAATISTNGLATIAYVNTATNGLVTAVVTNGLATTAYVTAAVTAVNGGPTNGVTAGFVTAAIAAATNGFVGANVTNGLATTAYVTTAINTATNGLSSGGGSTNGLATIAYVNASTNGLVTAAVTNGLATIAYANSLNTGGASTNGLATTNYVNAATNSLALYVQASTNGFVGASVTNGLATVAYVNTSTNGLVTAAVTNGLAATAYVNTATNTTYAFALALGVNETNESLLIGLSATNYVNASTNAANVFALAIGANDTNFIKASTNGFVGATVTNGLATTAYVQASTNGFVGATVTNGLATTAYTLALGQNDTNFALVIGANNTNNDLVFGANATNYVKASTNGLVTAAVTNGLATTAYTLAMGQNGSNYVSAATNTLANNLPGFLQGLVSTRSSYTNMAGVTNGGVVTYWPTPNITVMEEAVPQIPAAFAWVAVVDLANQTKIFVTPPNPGASLLMTNDTIKCQVLPFMQTNGAFLGINGNLFSYVDSNPYAKVVGFSASAGQVCSPFTTQPPVDGGGQYPNQSYAIVGNAPAINIDPSNNATIVTRGASGTTIAQTGTTVWNAFSGSAQILTAGVNTVPTYTTSGGPLTVMNGYSDANSWYALNTARVSMSINQAGNKLYIVVIDSTNSTYLTVSNEVNFVLLDHTYLFPTAGNQPYNGLSMDGGGSACMTWVNPVTQTAGIINPSGQINQRSCALDIAIGYQGAVAPALPGNLVALATSPLGNFGTNALVGGNLIPAPGGVLSPTNMPLNIYVNNVTFTNGITGVTNATAPANTTTIRVWINFTNTAGVLFKLPGYQ
jgi:hypothetical protein